MSLKKVVSGVYAISLGMVNVFLLDGQELTLIDAGVAGAEDRILKAVAELGRQPGDVRHILITHPHADHIGALPALQRATGAQVSMHALDAAAYRQGSTIQRVEHNGGLLSRLVVNFINRSVKNRPPTSPNPASLATIDHILSGGEELPLAGGLRVLHVPGHTSGHLAFLWPHQGGVLFVGDLASHIFGLGFSPLYEDFAEGRRTLRSLGELEFETACFAHGGPLSPGAAAQFRKKFS